MKKSILLVALLLVGLMPSFAQLHIEKDFYVTGSFGGVYRNNANMKVWNSNPKGYFHVNRDQVQVISDLSFGYIADDTYSLGIGFSYGYNALDQVPDLSKADSVASFYLPLDFKSSQNSFSPCVFFQAKYELSPKFAVALNGNAFYRNVSEWSFNKVKVDSLRQTKRTKSSHHYLGVNIAPVLLYQVNRDFGFMLSVNAFNYEVKRKATADGKNQHRVYASILPEQWRLGFYLKF